MKELHRSAKQDKITGGATSITSSNLTASRALVSDGSGKVAASSVTSTELGHLSGVTSKIQTQINAKAAASDLTSHIGDTTKHITATERSTWNAKQDAITGAATTITASNLTANMVMVTDSTGKVDASSSITTSELSALNNYLVGEKGNIKTRFEAVEAAIDTITGGGLLPDWSGALAISTSPYTANANGFFIAKGGTGDAVSVEIGNVKLNNASSSGSAVGGSVMVPVAKGDVITWSGGNDQSAWFVPLK